jgi:hypothetical protein
VPLEPDDLLYVNYRPLPPLNRITAALLREAELFFFPEVPMPAWEDPANAIEVTLLIEHSTGINSLVEVATGKVLLRYRPTGRPGGRGDGEMLANLTEIGAALSHRQLASALYGLSQAPPPMGSLVPCGPVTASSMPMGDVAITSDPPDAEPEPPKTWRQKDPLF